MSESEIRNILVKYSPPLTCQQISEIAEEIASKSQVLQAVTAAPRRIGQRLKKRSE